MKVVLKGMNSPTDFDPTHVGEFVDRIYPHREGRDIVLEFVLKAITHNALLSLCEEGLVRIDIEGDTLVFSLVDRH